MRFYISNIGIRLTVNLSILTVESKKKELWNNSIQNQTIQKKTNAKVPLTFFLKSAVTGV